MTEDDTFDVLRRISFTQLNNIIRELPYDELNHIRVNEERLDNFLSKYGWTLKSANKELEKLKKEYNERG